MCSDVGKDGLSYGNSARIYLSPLRTTHLAGHSPGKVGELNCNGNPPLLIIIIFVLNIVIA